MTELNTIPKQILCMSASPIPHQILFDETYHEVDKDFKERQ